MFYIPILTRRMREKMNFTCTPVIFISSLIGSQINFFSYPFHSINHTDTQISDRRSEQCYRSIGMNKRNTIIQCCPKIIFPISEQSHYRIIVQLIIPVKMPKQMSFLIYSINTIQNRTNSQYRIPNHYSPVAFCPSQLSVYIRTKCRNSTMFIHKQSTVDSKQNHSAISIRQYCYYIVITYSCTLQKKMKTLPVKLIETSINHLSINFFMTSIKIQRAESTFSVHVADSLSVVRIPAGKRLEIDFFSQAYDVPDFIVRTYFIFNPSTQRMILHLSIRLPNKVTELFERTNIYSIVINKNRTDNISTGNPVKFPGKTIVDQQAIIITKIHYSIVTLRTRPVLMTSLIIFYRIVCNGRNKISSPDLRKGKKRKY